MAKRSAEKQLTKDSRSDDEDDSGEQTGFRRADEKTLSGRVIRGMPKRAGGTPLGSFAVDKPVATPGTPTPAPKFAGFGSFTSPSGGEASGSSPSFGAKTFPFPAAKPPSMAFATSNPTPPLTPSSDGGEDDLFKYYSKLRGLNVSIMDACKKAVQADPFVDLSSIFKQYNDHRASIEKTRTAAAQPAASALKSVNGSALASSAPSDIPKPPAVPSSFAFSPFPSASTPAPAPKLTAPSAPPTFAPFLPPSASSSSAAATSTTPTTTPSTTTTTTESPAKSAFSFGSKSAFSFGAPPAAPSTDKETKSVFSFGAPTTSTTSSDDKSTAKSAFSFDKPSSFSAGTEDKSTTKSGFSFGAPSASSGWPTASSTADAAKATETKPLSSFFGASPSTFGSSSLFSSPSSTPTPAAPTGSDTSPSAKPAFSFGFGSSASPFAPVKGSLGNPVGFSFGAPSKAPAADSEGTGSAASGAEESSQGETPAAEGAPITLEPSAYDKEGAGEEDEETTYSERCKAYKLGKKDGAAEWVDLGVGMLRCKKHKSTDVRRVLMRGSGSGRVILNFVVFASLKPTQQKKEIAFVAIDDGEPASFRLRVKNEAQAVALKEALLKEVEAVAAKKA